MTDNAPRAEAAEAEVERLRAHHTKMTRYDEGLVKSERRRAEAAEAEVERLTRECLDREATETDARERLRQTEQRLAAVDALPEELREVRDMLRGPNYGKPMDCREANAYDHVRERLSKILGIPRD